MRQNKSPIFDGTLIVHDLVFRLKNEMNAPDFQKVEEFCNNVSIKK